MEYKKSTETTFFDDDSPNNPDTTATEAVAISGNTTASITGLEADTSYQVRVQATNGEGDRALVVRGDRLDQQGGQQPAPVERSIIHPPRGT